MTSTYTPRRLRRTLAVSMGAALAATTASPGARAAEPVIDNSHFQVTFEHVEQDIGECLDVSFPLHHDGETNARIQVRTRGTDGPTYFSLRFNTHDVYTNLATGESFTATEVVRNADSRVVENPDGTLTIAFSAMETTTVHTPTGALLGVDSGRVTGTVLLDPGDPADPEDDVVISEELSDATGVSRLGGFDLCAVAETLLG
jgi:hypothetical protein